MDLLTGPLPPVDRIEFGKLFAPYLMMAEFVGGQWSDLRCEPMHALEMHPASVVFHYGQSIFEGLKAFPRPGGEAALFRPELSARRFRDSARRMLLPDLSEDVFLRAVTENVSANFDFVPPRPGSLYLRPTMIGSEACIGVRGSRDALFFVLSLPAGSYFPEAKAQNGTIKVFVETKAARAARGGTGNVKSASNYAGTLKRIDEAKKLGCAQVLYLDSLGRGQLEEMGGMNVFVVVDGCLVTPPLNDSILPGMTRASVIEAAKLLGIPTEERQITIDEVLESIETGKLSEAFACGTAATIVGISELVFEKEKSHYLPQPAPGPITHRLLEYIQGVQYGTLADVNGWTRMVHKTSDVLA